MTAKKQDVAKTSNKAMMSDTRPDWMKEGTGRGSEGVTADDVTIPRIDVLQDLSPQIKSAKPEYIEGAVAGTLFNTVTDELYGENVIFVPVFFRKEYVIWKDRKKGGGFRGSFPTMEAAVAEMQELEDAQDCEILDTAQHFGIIVHEDGTLEEVVASMAKSKMKISRKLNSMAKLAGGDRFSRAYQLSAVADQNANNEDYYNLGIKQLGYVTKEVFAAAEVMYESVSSGKVGVSRTESPSSGSSDEAEREY